MSEPNTRAPGGRIAVVSAVLLDDLAAPRSLLAARRTEPPRLAGGWEIPGGKIDAGESAFGALHREIHEELGVRIRVGDPVPGPLAGWWPLAGDRYALRVWLAAIVDGTPQPLEDHSELRWLTQQSLWSVDWLPANVPIVRAVATTLWDTASGI